MDLSSLKNMDLNDLMSKLKSGGLADKKTLIKFGIGFVAVLVFLIGYYVFVSPIIKSQEEQIMLMEENKNKILEFNNNIVTVKKSIKKLEPEYKKNSARGHSYAVSILPQPLGWDVTVPSCLLCGSRKTLIDKYNISRRVQHPFPAFSSHAGNLHLCEALEFISSIYSFRRSSAS